MENRGLSFHIEFLIEDGPLVGGVRFYNIFAETQEDAIKRAKELYFEHTGKNANPCYVDDGRW